MILRPTFLTSAGGLPVVSAVALDLTIDGTLISIPDTVAAVYPLAPVVTTNGYTVVVDNDINGVAGNLKISIDTLRVWQSVSVKMVVTKATYETYSNTFQVYGYDLGNTYGGGGVLSNPSFVIITITTAQVGILPLIGVIAYRKPFTDRLYYYTNTACGGTCLLYDSTSGTDVTLGANGFIKNNDETVTIKTLNNSGGGATLNNTSAALVWFPKFNLSIDSDCPDGDCISTISSNTATVNVDYTTLSILQVNDADSYPFTYERIEWKLYDYAGVLLDTHYDEDVIVPTLTNDSFDWTGWNIPEAGSYIMEACLTAFEKPTGGQVTSGDLAYGLWYQIKDNSGGADWTNVGAPNNNVDTQFMATDSITPTSWGTGILEAIDKIYECCTRVPVTGCSWTNITQKDCNVYTVKNLSFETITLLVQPMTTLGTFDTGTTYTILLGQSLDITHASDNVYLYTITKGTDVLIQPIICTCGIQTCGLEFINDLLCYCKEDCTCDDFCEEYYNFNAFTVLSHTFFNMLNTVYSLDYMFTTLMPSKLAELYEIKQVLDKLKEYCEGCVECEDCKKTKTKCNCN